MTSGEVDVRAGQNPETLTQSGELRKAALPKQPATSFAVVVPVPPEWSWLVRYAVAVAATFLALAITVPLAPYLQRVILVLFWPAVIGAAWFGGVGPAVLASALSVFLADYFLLGPPGELAPTSPEDLFPLAVFLFASTAVALLTNATRLARRTAAQAAAQNADLAHELEKQAMELEQQLEESQSLSEELEQSTEELAERTAAAESAETYTKSILDSIAHPFVVHDAEWRFRFINEAAAAIFRESPRASNEPPIGRVLWEAYPDIVGTVFEREMRRAATERRPLTFEAFYPGRGEWLALSCFPLPDAGIATQWIDITARKRAEETEHYLGRASEVLASSLDYETTLKQLAQIVVPDLADWCALHIAEDDGVLRQLAVAHVDAAKVEWANELNRRYPPVSDAPRGVPNVLRTAKPELYPEITDDMLVAGAIDAEHLRITRGLGLKSALIVPLMSDDRAIGALTLVSAESGRRYSALDLPLAMELARRAATAVEHAWLHRQAVSAFESERAARQRTERLQQLTAALADADSEHEVARIVVSSIYAVLQPKNAAIFRIEDRGDSGPDLVMMDESGVDEPTRHEFFRLSLDGNAPLAELVRQQETVFLPDAAAFHARFPHWPASPPGQEAWVAIPLIASTGKALGALALGFAHVRTFDADLRRHVESIGDQATQAFERVRLLEAEHAAREAAEEANRAKTQFLATMSHELRTPLNAISGYAELLSLGLRGPTTPEQQEDLGRIMRSQRHLLSVINDILNFARLEAGHVEYHITNVRANDLLGDLESLIRPQLAAKQLELSWTPVSDDVVVRADSEKVRQVLLNLLANAVKFTAPGGRIRVECEHDESRVYVRVSDTGIGIPVDRRGAIFEPFVQLHRTLAQPAEGTGLGLAISRDLARGMGGELTVESEPGKGSTFTLILDRAR
jgi:signal transduction histidine kinase/PAS domain-containing protein